MSFSRKNEFTVHIPREVFDKVQDDIVWPIVNAFPVKHLIKKIFDTIQAKDFDLEFDTFKEEYAPYADIHFMGSESGKKHLIRINTTRTRLDELPACIIHEILHSMFPQLHDDKYVLDLEFKVMRSITKKQVDKLLHIVFSKIKWHFSHFERRVESIGTIRKSKRNSPTKCSTRI